MYIRVKKDALSSPSPGSSFPRNPLDSHKGIPGNTVLGGGVRQCEYPIHFLFIAVDHHICFLKRIFLPFSISQTYAMLDSVKSVGESMLSANTII